MKFKTPIEINGHLLSQESNKDYVLKYNDIYFVEKTKRLIFVGSFYSKSDPKLKTLHPGLNQFIFSFNAVAGCPNDLYSYSFRVVGDSNNDENLSTVRAIIGQQRTEKVPKYGYM